MPRLTNADYLEQRYRLVDAWEFRPGLLAQLKTFEQRDLHRFFAMSAELYEDEALAHRRKISSEQPSLPNQAGRAYARFQQVMAEDQARRVAPQQRTNQRRPQQRRVIVDPLVRPEFDAHGLAQAIVEMAMKDLRKEEAALSRNDVSNDATSEEAGHRRN